VASSLIFL